MNLQQRLENSQQTFNQLKTKRDKLIAEADEVLAEMNRCQGEYRVLKDLIGEEANKEEGKE